MIKHIVVWHLKDSAAGNTREENALIIKDRLEALMGKMDGLRFIQVGVGISDGGWDACLYSEFDDMESLNLYAKHPLHLEVQKFVHEVITDRASCDFETE